MKLHKGDLYEFRIVQFVKRKYFNQKYRYVWRQEQKDMNIVVVDGILFMEERQFSLKTYSGRIHISKHATASPTSYSGTVLRESYFRFRAVLCLIVVPISMSSKTVLSLIITIVLRFSSFTYACLDVL